MIEIIIHGRGGQGGVTLAKLIAAAYFRAGKHVQAFGLYAAERSGAPVQAFVRIDDREITNHNQIQTPNHVIVLDPTLIGPANAAGLKTDGWIILNTRQDAGEFAPVFPGQNVAVVDATGLAVQYGLGTRAVPIVNTTMFGAVARVLNLKMEDVEQVLAQSHFAGNNAIASWQAFEIVRYSRLSGRVMPSAAATRPSEPAGLLDECVGGLPLLKTGSWATMRPESRRLESPCNHVCPAGNDVRGFIQELTRGESDSALEILLRTSPFPGVCGRVCPAPCMENCNRQWLDEAVNVRELERFAADHGQRPPPTMPYRNQTIGIIGSGPGGLSAAYALAQLGYPVTIYESNSELGGLLRTGIPAYRLPRNILNDEIKYILAHGVHAATGAAIDNAGLIRLTREHAAVLIAAGLQESRPLNLAGDFNGIVIQGLDFLERARRQAETVTDQEIVVIGGGNTAVDAARSARRLGAKRVHIVYRRTREEMPAIEEEIAEALEEGIVLDELVSPLRLRRDALGALLTCQRMRLGDPDESGRRSPTPEDTEDAQFDLRCDRVVLALGQTVDLSLLPVDSELKDGCVSLGRTGAPVYTCGDFATNSGTVAAAIGSGRKAAWTIHKALSGEDLFPKCEFSVAGPEVMRNALIQKVPSRHGEALPASIRRRNFDEVRTGFSPDDSDRCAATEAMRCLSCGVCTYCDRCMAHCPEGVIVRNADGYQFDYRYCKGCGLCAEQCPRGGIAMLNI